MKVNKGFHSNSSNKHRNNYKKISFNDFYIEVILVLVGQVLLKEQMQIPIILSSWQYPSLREPQEWHKIPPKSMEVSQIMSMMQKKRKRSMMKKRRRIIMMPRTYRSKTLKKGMARVDLPKMGSNLLINQYLHRRNKKVRPYDLKCYFKQK